MKILFPWRLKSRAYCPYSLPPPFPLTHIHSKKALPKETIPSLLLSILVLLKKALATSITFLETLQQSKNMSVG